MSKRPKLSGAQGRKKRKEEEEKREKDRDALLKFLNPTPGPSTTSTAAASTSAAQPTSDAASAAQPSHDAAASSGLPVASTSAAQPTSFAAASSGVTLTHDSQPDINGTELAMEMQNFPPLPSKNMTNMELLTFLHEKKLAEIYPNMWVALRIFATLPVTVAAAERSFSKLKLIKTYLRSTMMQERLSGLSIISINHVVSNQLSYDDVVDDFAARKTRRVRL
ncbi:uncharacterized protein LOC106097293 [Oreochromis niloticus]|uniref:uncharacterized protein LOC106097293 n=1 Tax=Oreochromis niloticus TaxID=8128 RepID=UPI0009058B75|nr:uncharacterized protein LOC106097293 [Oreochromis niloticus]